MRSGIGMIDGNGFGDDAGHAGPDLRRWRSRLGKDVGAEQRRQSLRILATVAATGRLAEQFDHFAEVLPVGSVTFRRTG